jgi:hypothetical protein
MATYRGQDVVIKIGGDQIENLKNVTLETSVNLIETTVIGNAARTRTAGLSDYSLNMDVFLDSTSPAQSTLIEGATFTWEGYFEGDSTGQLQLSGTAIVENVSLNGELEDMVGKSISAVNNHVDGIVRGTV